jgi:photosystem II stability/assembly factor-like uncharacterized protein
VSRNGGATWSDVQPLIGEPGNAGTVQVSFFDSVDGYVFGYGGAESQATVWHTSNGGLSWTHDVPKID